MALVGTGVGKGDGQRLAQIKDYENRLNWALSSSKTDPKVKQEILTLLELKREVQCKIADINIDDKQRQMYRKMIDGSIPVGVMNGSGSEDQLFFPWSSIPEIVQITKTSKELITTLVPITTPQSEDKALESNYKYLNMWTEGSNKKE